MIQGESGHRERPEPGGSGEFDLLREVWTKARGWDRFRSAFGGEKFNLTILVAEPDFPGTLRIVQAHFPQHFFAMVGGGKNLDADFRGNGQNDGFAEGIACSQYSTGNRRSFAVPKTSGV